MELVDCWICHACFVIKVEQQSLMELVDCWICHACFVIKYEQDLEGRQKGVLDGKIGPAVRSPEGCPGLRSACKVAGSRKVVLDGKIGLKGRQKAVLDGKIGL